MLKGKDMFAVGLAASYAVTTLQAGERLEFPSAPVKPMLNVMVTATTSSAAVMSFNTTTFAAVDPPPPVVPPRDRQEQG